MSISAPPPPGSRSWLSALAVYFERRPAVMLALGFSAGLPNVLLTETITAWLREAGLPLEVIGFFTLATLTYSFKFLWAPLVDRTSVPGLTSRLGHRRSWMLLSQALIMAGLWLLAGSDPRAQLPLMALLAVMVGFASANQDVVIDAWRIEVAEDARQGAMAAAYQWGYRIASILAGVLPLVIAQHHGWSLSYAVMAAFMLVGVAAVLLAPREPAHAPRPIDVSDIRQSRASVLAEWTLRLAVLALGGIAVASGLRGKADLPGRILSALGAPDQGAALEKAWVAPGLGPWLQLLGVLAGFAVVALAAMPIPRVATRPGRTLSRALGEPLVVFFETHRGSAALILALICLYRIADNVLNIMTPFYLDLGFTLTEIGGVRKAFGVWMTMLGVFLGGLLVARLGLVRALLVGAFAGPLSNMAFIWLATRGSHLPSLATAIAIDNVAGGLSGTCLIAYMSSLTTAGFTATQYALFSSLYVLPGKILASQSGRIVEGVARGADAGGWPAPLMGLFAHTPPGAFAASLDRSGVSPPALGAGYVVFFLYSTAIGALAVALAVRLWLHDRRSITSA